METDVVYSMDMHPNTSVSVATDLMAHPTPDQ